MLKPWMYLVFGAACAVLMVFFILIDAPWYSLAWPSLGIVVNGVLYDASRCVK